MLIVSFLRTPFNALVWTSLWKNNAQYLHYFDRQLYLHLKGELKETIKWETTGFLYIFYAYHNNKQSIYKVIEIFKAQTYSSNHRAPGDSIWKWSKTVQCCPWLLQNADVDFDKTAINLSVRPFTSVSTNTDVNIDKLVVIGLFF